MAGSRDDPYIFKDGPDADDPPPQHQRPRVSGLKRFVASAALVVIGAIAGLGSAEVVGNDPAPARDPLPPVVQEDQRFCDLPVLQVDDPALPETDAEAEEFLAQLAADYPELERRAEQECDPEANEILLKELIDTVGGLLELLDASMERWPDPTQSPIPPSPSVATAAPIDR